MLSGLETRKLADSTDVMVVSDHGVAQTSPERVIIIDDLIALDDVDVSDWTPVLSLWPKPGRAEAVFEKLRGAHPHLAVYRAADLPPRWHLGTHRRVPPIVTIADEGWTITTREQFAKQRQRWDYGNHGYDSALESKRAIFIARGPPFRRGVTVPPVENIHLYELMCRILDLQPVAERRQDRRDVATTEARGDAERETFAPPHVDQREDPYLNAGASVSCMKSSPTADSPLARPAGASEGPPRDDGGIGGVAAAALPRRTADAPSCS